MLSTTGLKQAVWTDFVDNFALDWPSLRQQNLAQLQIFACFIKIAQQEWHRASWQRLTSWACWGARFLPHRQARASCWVVRRQEILIFEITEAKPCTVAICCKQSLGFGGNARLRNKPPKLGVLLRAVFAAQVGASCTVMRRQKILILKTTRTHPCAFTCCQSLNNKVFKSQTCSELVD